MTTLDFAMQMEKDGEDFYRNLAKKSRRPSIKKILKYLAQMEAQHYEALLALKSSSDIKWDKTFRDGIKSIFATLDEATNGFDVDVSELELYKEAQELEERSREFYVAKARRVKSPSEKRFLQQLAQEEQEHWQMLQSIIEFLEEPLEGKWLENAEWYHQDTY